MNIQVHDQTHTEQSILFFIFMQKSAP